MIEAVRDYSPNDCGTANDNCFRARSDFDTYKHDSSCNSKNNDINSYDFSNWKTVITNYVFRSSCLFRINHLDRETFINLITPNSIFEKEITIYEESEHVFILSCLPEFLIDYSDNYWNASIGKQKRPTIRARCNIFEMLKHKKNND